MALVEITAKKKIDGIEHSATVGKDFGEDINDAVEKFGAEVVFANFKASVKITAQAAMRRYMDAGKSDAEIPGLMENWKPGMPSERKAKDPVAQLIGKWKDMDESERADLLRKLKTAESE